jgi:uncharacterized membrane protein YphA (DoxX/SURF4 family)
MLFVLLRLAIGWHFLEQGLEKVSYDTSEGRYRVTFSAEPFLSQATGPLADRFHEYVPNAHDWPTLLAVARQDAPTDGEQAPNAPSADWENQIASDWKSTMASVLEIPGLSEDQRQAVDDAFQMREKQLADYLTGEAAAIKDYQHELWRLEQMQSAPEANVPFMQERIAAKEAELRGTPRQWVDQVKQFEEAYYDDLRGVLTKEQLAEPTTTATIDEATTDPRAAKLEWVSRMATYLTIGVGACLLLGCFTRLASLAGAAFLLAVMSTQPPWVAGAVTTYFPYQLVEFFALLVLAAVGAGRWLGVDYFPYALWNRLFGSDNS